MEKQVIFRDRQETTADDLNNIGGFAADAMDRLVAEGMADGKYFTKFEVAKSGATAVSVAPGTYWAGGKRYIREEVHSIDFLGSLPMVTQKIAAIVVTGSEITTDVQPRAFLINVDTNQDEPSSVAMKTLRYASFQIAYGTESSTPLKPTISTDVLVIAWVTLSTTGVESVEANTDGAWPSNESLAARATELEEWQAEAGNQITTLGSDIASLSDAIAQSANQSLLTRVFSDLAIIKDKLDLEDGYSGYGAENFLALEQSITSTAPVDYYAKVEEGLRFPDAGANEIALTLFNPLDASVSIASNGLCLPAYTEVTRLALKSYYQQLSISQYEYQTVAWKLMAMSAQRLRFGVAFTKCNNSEFWKSGTYDSKTGIFTDKLGRTYQVLNTDEDTSPAKGGFRGHAWIRLQQFWYDVETEYYQKRVVTDYSVDGAMIAETYLNTQNGWLTSLDLFFTQKASSGNVRVLITRTTGGRPDLDQVLAETTLTPANLVVGSKPTLASHWTRASFIPTYLSAGERYAFVIITSGNHYVGLTQGENYAAGTLFYSTDGAFFQGDLTVDMMFKANFARFSKKRAEVDLGALSLSGGIEGVDIAFEGVVPAGCEHYFEVRPQGSSTWTRIGEGESTPFSGLPALASFRAVFVGTRDLMPAMRLTGSSVTMNRPATTFTWFSEQLTLPAPTQTVKVIVTLDKFREAHHDFDLRLYDVTNSVSNLSPSTVVDTVLDERDGVRKQIRREYTWASAKFPVATSLFYLKATGSITAATEVFHGERLIYMSF